MITRYIVSAERIHSELENVEQVVARVRRALEATAADAADRDLYWDALALNLHDFYTGLERILRHIAAEIDGHLPAGQELLQQMAIPLPHIRPAVFSTAVVQRLDEYLRFRHVVRRGYTFEFDSRRIQPLAAALTDDFAQIAAELAVFINYLKELADAD